MKAKILVRSLLVPAVLVAATALADASSAASATDAHGRAAALLRGATSSAVVQSATLRLPVPASKDGQAQAAALLRRPETPGTDEVVTRRGSSSERLRADGHMKAAALLSRPRTI